MVKWDRPKRVFGLKRICMFLLILPVHFINSTYEGNAAADVECPKNKR